MMDGLAVGTNGDEVAWKTGKGARVVCVLGLARTKGDNNTHLAIFPSLDL